MLIRKEPPPYISTILSLSFLPSSRAHFHREFFNLRIPLYVASNVFITRLEDVSPALLSSCMGPTGQPDDDFMPAFTRWKREHFESGFLELRGGREGGREVSGIALSTGRVTHRPQRRTSTDFNFYSTTLPRQLCSYVASLFFPPSLLPPLLSRLA